MGEHIRTVGYLLKNYQKSQCYEQYVNLKWLELEIAKLMTKGKDIGDVLVLLNYERKG